MAMVAINATRAIEGRMVRIGWTSVAPAAQGSARHPPDAHGAGSVPRPGLTPHRSARGRPSPDEEEAPMERSLAHRILLAALAVGLLAEVSMDGPAVGLNVPIVTAAMLAGAW